MPLMSFRLKIFAAMMVVVIGVTAAVLYSAHQRFSRAQQDVFLESSRTANWWQARLRDTRISEYSNTVVRLNRSVRTQALMRQLNNAIASEAKTRVTQVSEKLYLTARDELRFEGSQAGQGEGSEGPLFFRLIDENHQVVAPPPGSKAGSFGDEEQRINGEISSVAKRQTEELALTVDGYLDWRRGLGEARPKELMDVLVSPIIDRRGSVYLGAFAIGYPAGDAISPDGSALSSEPGIYLNGRLYRGRSRWEGDWGLPGLVSKMVDIENTASGGREVILDGQRYQLFARVVGRDVGFSRPYQTSAYSWEKWEAAQRKLRNEILRYGAIGFFAAIWISGLISRGLSRPIRELVVGAKAVQGGDYSTKLPVRAKDEVGQLTDAFNEMTVGLALKERYRSVLDKVSDPDIAQELVDGEVSLGGEARKISVLFCDIRGFTALTQNMEPEEVITMLNEHFAPLTRIVNECHGVVDKFVGDLIMAIFGAPKTYGDDAFNAVNCAHRMITERAAMNAQGEREILMGIGVATGLALAGNMGSEHRMNYTVLGERVNLASRLCGQANAMETVIDEETKREVNGRIEMEALPPMSLKGFDKPVPAYGVLSIKTIK